MIFVQLSILCDDILTHLFGFDLSRWSLNERGIYGLHIISPGDRTDTSMVQSKLSSGQMDSEMDFWANSSHDP